MMAATQYSFIANIPTGAASIAVLLNGSTVGKGTMVVEQVTPVCSPPMLPARVWRQQLPYA
ncbi:MAG TPA: hypothetical protein VEX68_28180 [Bryobacteraceae bacterium]|nr:hypothetical protein [Bryobacteraceae bacterium]